MAKRSLPLLPGQREAYGSIVERVMARMSKLPPEKLYLRPGTSAKIDHTGNQIAWSLPAGPNFSCPGATADCRACYAQQGHHVRENVVEAFVRNWLRFRWLEENSTVEAAAAEILKNVISPVLGLFRIHESGDFHSQWAVDVWTEVVRKKPRVAFWAYTRSFDFDFSRLIALPNVRLYASTDSKNFRQARAFVAAHGPKVAFAFGPYIPGEKLPARSYECPPTADKYLRELKTSRTKPFGHESACVRCRACIPDEDVAEPRNIVFYTHARSQGSTGASDVGLDGLGSLPPKQHSVSLALFAPGLTYDGCAPNDGDPVHFP